MEEMDVLVVLGAGRRPDLGLESCACHSGAVNPPAPSGGDTGWDPAARAGAWDAALLAASVLLVIWYHIWYYSWRFQNLVEDRGFHRVDLTGQRAREIFVRSVISGPPGPSTDGSYANAEAATNIALQAARNPITAVSILATGATVGATTLVGILLDAHKMEMVRQLAGSDPLTGASTLVSPEAKLLGAVGVLLLSFFSLAQSLRLFIHFSWFVRAARFCTDHREYYSDGTTETMVEDAVKTCLRAQTFNSLGFRFLYIFIPAMAWLMGGTYLMGATLATVVALYNLDQI